jgi:hypothetical protein
MGSERNAFDGSPSPFASSPKLWARPRLPFGFSRKLKNDLFLLHVQLNVNGVSSSCTCASIFLMPSLENKTVIENRLIQIKAEFTDDNAS